MRVGGDFNGNGRGQQLFMGLWIKLWIHVKRVMMADQEMRRMADGMDNAPLTREEWERLLQVVEARVREAKEELREAREEVRKAAREVLAAAKAVLHE